MFNIHIFKSYSYIFSWGRWSELLELGQFKRGWRDIDVEDCARIIVSVIRFESIDTPKLYKENLMMTNHANIEKTLGFR